MSRRPTQVGDVVKSASQWYFSDRGDFEGNLGGQAISVLPVGSPGVVVELDPTAADRAPNKVRVLFATGQVVWSGNNSGWLSFVGPPGSGTT